jgi:hypothetical protein
MLLRHIPLVERKVQHVISIIRTEINCSVIWLQKQKKKYFENFGLYLLKKNYFLFSKSRTHKSTLQPLHKLELNSQIWAPT